jgi:hypothetical protein
MHNLFRELAETFLHSTGCVPTWAQNKFGRKLLQKLPAADLVLFQVLVKTETHFHADLYIHRPAIFHGGLEVPLLDCFNRFRIEPIA